MAEELTFRLEDFEGPLELLLTLVQKHKMDLHNIPILELIDQYTRAVESAESTDPEISSAFIEMAAHLVEMKSYLLLPRSEEGERMKQELTGQLIEYDQCRRMAARLRERGEEYTVFVRTPARLEWDNTYDLFHSPQVLADCWQALMGRTTVRKMPTQQQFEPLVSAPQVSVSSRVVYILRQLIAGGAKKMDQLFSRRQTRGANVATFLALLELVRGGRVTLGPEGSTARALPERGQRPVPAPPEHPLAAGHQDRICGVHPPCAGHPPLHPAGPGGHGDPDRHRLQPACLPRLHRAGARCGFLLQCVGPAGKGAH